MNRSIISTSNEGTSAASCTTTALYQSCLVPSPHLSHNPIAGLSNVIGRKGLEVSEVSTGLRLAGCRDCSEAARTQALHCQRSRCKVTPDTDQGKKKSEGLKFLVVGARFRNLLVMDLSSVFWGLLHWDISGCAQTFWPKHVARKCLQFGSFAVHGDCWPASKARL